MPIMFVHYPAGMFDKAALDEMSVQLTREGQEVERLTITPFVRSTAAIYYQEYDPDRIYHGGQPGGSPTISVFVNVIQGGFSEGTKKELIRKVTDIVARHGKLPRDEPKRVYVFVREVAESSFGFDGVPIDLEELRRPTDPDRAPL